MRLIITLPFNLLNWKLAHRLLLAWRTFTPILVLRPFLGYKPVRDRQTDGRARPVMWRPISTTS